MMEQLMRGTGRDGVATVQKELRARIWSAVRSSLLTSQSTVFSWRCVQAPVLSEIQQIEEQTPAWSLLALQETAVDKDAQRLIN